MSKHVWVEFDVISYFDARLRHSYASWLISQTTFISSEDTQSHTHTHTHLFSHTEADARRRAVTLKTSQRVWVKFSKQQTSTLFSFFLFSFHYYVKSQLERLILIDPSTTKVFNDLQRSSINFDFLEEPFFKRFCTNFVSFVDCILGIFEFDQVLVEID